MDTIANRIKKGLEMRNMKQSELVEKTKIGKSSISTYISGAYEPKQRNIYKIASALDVNEAWLMGYDVPMEKEIKSSYDDDISNNIENENTISIKELKLLSNFNKLNKTGKDEAIKRVSELTLIPSYIEEPEDLSIKTIAAHNDHLTEHGEMDKIMQDIEDMKKW